MPTTAEDGAGGAAALGAPAAANGAPLAAEAAGAAATNEGDPIPIALHVHTISESSYDAGWDLLQETGNMLGHFMLGVLQGLVGLVPLMLMWSLLCTLVALLLLPCDVVLAVVHVVKQARAQGLLKTVCGLLLVVVVAAMWPVVVCTFHLMAAFVLAFSEPFEHQPTDEWHSLALGGLCSMFSFAMDRMTDFLKLCWVSRVDFWLKWKMMVRAVTSFLVFFLHVAVTGVSSLLLTVVKLPVIAVIGGTLPWALCANLSCCFAGNNKLLQVALWLVTVPFIAPMVLVISVLSCALFVVAYTVGSSFLIAMSVLGGGLYVADCQFKKMSWPLTRRAMAYVITEFDKDTSELLSHVIMEEAEVGRLLPVLQDPYPEFTTDESAAGLESQANSLDESCEAFLDSCKVQSQALMASGWLQAADFLNAEPFLFMGVPGHVLLTYLQQSPYEALLLKPGYEVKLQDDFLGTSWVDPLRQELLTVQVQVFETCMEEEEWKYLKAWVLLSGDEDRMPALALQLPPNAQRVAQLHRVAGAVNSMAISITRMSWFQAHFQKRVMDAALESSTAVPPPEGVEVNRKPQKLSLKPSTVKLDTGMADVSPNSIPAIHVREPRSPCGVKTDTKQSGPSSTHDESVDVAAHDAASHTIALHLLAADEAAAGIGCSQDGSSQTGGACGNTLPAEDADDHVTIEMADAGSQ